jgi:hypothetical protein
MSYRFEKHYTLQQARALLPRVQEWLKQIADLRGKLQKHDSKIETLMEPGSDVGGTVVNRWVEILAQLKEVLVEFQRREIQIKDLDRGLIDFPAIIQGREVFLCWESGEEDIEFWHDLDAGYAGRERLTDPD